MSVLNTQSLINPKRPSGEGWRPATWWSCPPQLMALGGYAVEPWEHGNGLFVLSAVEVAAPEPGEIPLGPEYHLSVSRHGNRCTSQEAKWVLRQFGLEDATEDNHVPSGRVRNFWRPVADHLSGHKCPCADIEPTMAEDKGDFIWRGVTR